MNFYSRARPILKPVVGAGLGRLGLRLERIKELARAPSMDGALDRAALRGTEISTVIDVGASDGEWSRKARTYFTEAQYVLIEAQPIHKTALESFVRFHAGAQFVLAAAGDHIGRTYFDASDPFGGRAGSDHVGGAHIEVPMTTIDAVASDLNLTGPYCLKLDTHGFELPILNGASHVLSDSRLVILECYNFRLPGALLFHEMCAHMDHLGFRCIDLVDQMYRPRDRALWQADLCFAPKSDGVFSWNDYE
jgi:FkbM family methyltransferase